MQEANDVVEAIKDEDAEHPVPHKWRCTLREVVHAFVQGDYFLARGVDFVDPPSSGTASQIPAYLAAYGETLAELPEETWATSVAQWMETHWEVLVDLWTIESGPSDLVLGVQVFEAENGFRVRVDLVYVP